MTRRSQIRIVAPSASPLQAAAIVAALERFMHDTAPDPPAPRAAAAVRSAWAHAALLEATGHAGPRPASWGRE